MAIALDLAPPIHQQAAMHESDPTERNDDAPTSVPDEAPARAPDDGEPPRPRRPDVPGGPLIRKGRLRSGQ
ncbi:hypothetical protein J2X58_000588 [Luteibacter sp. 3190]|nr:hypothetical protein [Luteibacter sp. 3190]